MPYKDPEKQKAAAREAQRRRRGNASSPRHTTPPALAELRLETAKDVVNLLRNELVLFTMNDDLAPGERLRGVVGACGTLLRAFEQVDVVERLERLEALTGGLHGEKNGYQNTTCQA
jgi:hypothetical protein